jgi:hypothetical protein
MTLTKNLVAALIALSPLYAAAKDYLLNVKICEENSGCQKCIEDHKLTLSVDAAKKAVFARGISTEGKPLNEPLKNCKISSVNDWSCDQVNFRGELSAVGGKLIYKLSQPNLEVDNKRFDICVR